MPRARTAKHPKAEDVPEEKTTAGGEIDKGITKVQAVRNALDEGLEKPGGIADFALSRYGLVIAKQQISAYKSQIRSKQRIGEVVSKRGRKPKDAVKGYLAPPRITPSGEGDLLDAMEAMKPLVASLGAERVKRLVDLLV